MFFDSAETFGLSQASKVTTIKCKLVRLAQKRLRIPKNTGQRKRRLEKGDFKTLSPFSDDKGLTRVGGRVNPNLLSYDGKSPALLPYDHWISTLVTRDAHKAGHPGVAATTAKTRR